MMKKIIILAFIACVLTPIARVDSSSDRVNYEQIKDAYSKADAELNFVYKKQIQEYKKRGRSSMGRVSHVIYTLKNHSWHG